MNLLKYIVRSIIWMLQAPLVIIRTANAAPKNYKVVMINSKNLKANEKLLARISSGFVFEKMAAVLQPINSKMACREQLTMVVVVSTPLSMDSGFLTPVITIKRYQIEAAVGPQVDKWATAKARVVWQ